MTKDQISHDDLQSKLEDGIIKFFFQKKDGTLRVAIGTRDLDSIPVEHHPKGKGNPARNTVSFYDCVKETWRSISRDSVVWVS